MTMKSKPSPEKKTSAFESTGFRLKSEGSAPPRKINVSWIRI